MDNMRQRIDRRDIKLERAEAIKVRLQTVILYATNAIFARQCVTLQLIVLLNYNSYRRMHIFQSSQFVFMQSFNNFVYANTCNANDPTRLSTVMILHSQLHKVTIAIPLFLSK